MSRALSIVAGAVLLAAFTGGCDRSEAASGTVRVAPDKVDPWQPIDAAFKGCEGGCGERAAGLAPGVIAQPGAKPGDLAYCPVSGVVFRVGDRPGRGKRDVGHATLHFCCESCAEYFSKHRDQVIAARGYSIP